MFSSPSCVFKILFFSLQGPETRLGPLFSVYFFFDCRSRVHCGPETCLQPHYLSSINKLFLRIVGNFFF